MEDIPHVSLYMEDIPHVQACSLHLLCQLRTPEMYHTSGEWQNQPSATSDREKVHQHMHRDMPMCWGRGLFKPLPCMCWGRGLFKSLPCFNVYYQNMHPIQPSDYTSCTPPQTTMLHYTGSSRKNATLLHHYNLGLKFN